VIRLSVGPRTQLYSADPRGAMGHDAAYLGLLGSVTQCRYENPSLCLLAPGETQDQVLLEHSGR